MPCRAVQVLLGIGGTRVTLNTGRAQHTAMTPVNPNTHLLMNNMRVRGHRQGVRVLKGQENRVQKHATQTETNKTAKQDKPLMFRYM